MATPKEPTHFIADTIPRWANAWFGGEVHAGQFRRTEFVSVLSKETHSKRGREPS
jgi:hypothetical protein